MPPDGNIRATIEGDIKGQVVVGNFILQIGDVNGCVASVGPQTQGPNYARRSGPVNLRPRPFLALLDRDEEIATVKLAMQASSSISLFGPAGIGKTSILRSLAHLPETDIFPDGVAYLSVSALGLEDLLQSLFDAFYESQANFKPDETEIRTALHEVKALILLDELTLNRDETISLLGAAQSSMFVLASQEQILSGEGQQIVLTGLPAEEALDLFVLELNRSLNGQEQVEVREICGLLAGHPLHVLQSASLVREKLATIYAVKAQLQQDTPDEVVLRILLESSTDSQRSVIATLAAAGDIAVPVNHLEALARSTELKSDLQKLVSLGLVQAYDSKFNLAGDLSAAVTRLWDLTAWEDRLIEFLVDWLAKRPAQNLLDASVDLLVHAVQKAEQKSRWHDVVRIGRGLESTLVLWRRWQTWLDILNLILKAARALSDRKVEAWALHQIGTRAACLGFHDPARGFLARALKIRRATRDQAGQLVTQNNLHVFFDIPLPSNIGQSGWRRCLTCGTIVVGLIGIVSVAIAGLFLLLSSRSNQPAPPVIPTATATNTQTPTNPPDVTVSPPSTATPSASYTPTRTPIPEILVDFVLEANTAVWESSETFDPNDDVFGDCDLTFGAPPLPPCGFARWETTTLEDDSTLQNVLVVEPYHTNGAQIWGTYDLTALTIAEGARLVTVVGFLNSAETLGVAFQVSFTTGDPNFSSVLVYETRDRNDGELVEAVTLLPDEIIGQSGYFILRVLAAPNTNANWASWVVARLEQP